MSVRGFNRFWTVVFKRFLCRVTFFFGTAMFHTASPSRMLESSLSSSGL